MPDAAATGPTTPKPSRLSESDRAQLHETVDKMNLSDEEAKSFTKAFNDPEFLKLFGDYMNEIQDPAHRAENDMYLRQVEAEGRAEAVYGKGVELVVPSPGFCVKTTAALKHTDDAPSKKPRRRAVYVNVCFSPKVEDYKLEKAEGGSNLDLPFSLGSSRDEYTLHNEPHLPPPEPPNNTPVIPEGAKLRCTVHDLVVGEKTFEDAQKMPALKKAIVDIALENVSKHFYSDEIDANGDPKHEQPSKRGGKLDTTGASIISEPLYKMDAHDGKPSVQAIRTNKEGSTPGERIHPDKVGPGTAAEQEVAASVAKAQPPAPASASSFSFDKAVKRPGKKQPPAPPKVNELGEEEPRYELIHRDMSIEMESAWKGSSAGEASYQADVRRNQPRSLVVRIHLEKCSSVSGMILDVTSTTLKLRMPDVYCLDLKLPCAVQDEKGKAKFDKAKRTLEVTVPKAMEPAPPPRANDAERSASAGGAPAAAAAAAAADAPPLVQELPDPVPAAEAGASAAAAAATAAEPSKAAETTPEAADPAQPPPPPPPPANPSKGPFRKETENQRRWREIHEAQAPPAPAAPSPGTEDAADPAEAAPKKSVSFSNNPPPSANSSPPVLAGRGAADGDDDDDDDDLPEMPALEALDDGDNATATPSSSDAEGCDFSAANAFAGARPGFVFRKGDRGVGYYRDVPMTSAPQANAALPKPAPAQTPKPFVPAVTHALIDEMD